MDAITIGKVYRQKPNASTVDLPEVVIVVGKEPGEEHFRHVEYVTFLNTERVFYSDRERFLSRYFQVTEDWHLQGL